MDFFKGERRKLRLKYWYPKRGTQNEKRICMDFAMVLTGQSTVKMPAEIRVAYEAVSRVENSMPYTEIEAMVDPQTIEFFATDKSPRRFKNFLVAAELQSLHVSRTPVVKSDAANTVELHFKTTVPCDAGQDSLLEWAWVHNGMSIWATFEATQGNLVADAKAAEAAADKKEKKAEKQPKLPLTPDPAAIAHATRRSGKDAAAGS